LSALEEKNLAVGLEGLFKKLSDGAKVQTTFTCEGRTRSLPLDWEENLVRIGQEALTNALRHSLATEFAATLIFEDGAVRLVMRDNGCGFTTGQKRAGFGLQGMAEHLLARISRK
jgi:signal transduction histidine kinase